MNKKAMQTKIPASAKEGVLLMSRPRDAGLFMMVFNVIYIYIYIDTMFDTETSRGFLLGDSFFVRYGAEKDFRKKQVLEKKLFGEVQGVLRGGRPAWHSAASSDCRLFNIWIAR